MGNVVDTVKLERFVVESFRIEGIWLRQSECQRQIELHEWVLSQVHWSVHDMEILATEIAGEHAKLRSEKGMDVRVGSHLPEKGGPIIPSTLSHLLHAMANDACAIVDLGGPFMFHRWFETIHPFMDGNGRTGRALWLWHMQQIGKLGYALELGFLHAWYYQSLDAER